MVPERQLAATNRQAFKGNASAQGKNLGLNGDSTLADSQSKFHVTLGNKDKKILELEQANNVLINTIEDLKGQLNKYDINHSEVSPKVCQIQSEIIQVKVDKEKAASSLALQQEETSKIKTAIAQLQTQLENQQKKSMQEKTALKNEIEQLKQELKSQNAHTEEKQSVLLAEMDRKSMLYTNAIRKIDHLNSVILAENTKKEEATNHFAQQVQDLWKLKAAAVDIKDEIEEQKRKFEQDKVRLLSEKTAIAFNMNAEVLEAQTILENGLQLCKKEQSFLLEAVSNLKQDLEKKEEERKSSIGGLMDRMQKLEEQLDNMKKQKQKKQCALTRFFRLFRRT